MIPVVFKYDLGQTAPPPPEQALIFMLMIPLTFVLAILVALFLAWEVTHEEIDWRRPWFVLYLLLFIFQEILIGLRFGYGYDALFKIQPFTASLIPPLAYLSFIRPPPSRHLLVHLLPLLGVIFALLVNIEVLDAVLAFSTFAYTGLLIQLGLRGPGELSWVELRRINVVYLLLWITVVILTVSGITDLMIAMDFWKYSGANLKTIVGSASIYGVGVPALLIFISCLYWRKSRQVKNENPEEAAAVFAKLNSMMAEDKLYLNPDINLNRIARRMILPTRDVSRAINICTGDNVSKYINSLRIEEACRQLQETDLPITQIVFASGFNTKSNFHREFSRLTGQSPSDWREKIALKEQR